MIDPHSTLEQRHQETLFKMVEQNFAALKKAMKSTDKNAGKSELHELLQTTLHHGLNFALEAEGRAWKRASELEDLIIGIVQHAPGSDLERARKFAETFERESR